MVHLPHLITDLGLILASAGLITLLFRKIKQPVVLGYILAGLIVGPHFPLFPTITDEESIRIWAEIGVIFLLFTLGLEFSFKKLVKVGGAASVTAIIEVIFMVIIGYFTGMAMGWGRMDSIFLGGILSISSTTIIIRAFDELGVKTQKFAGLVFGVLIVEDLVAILLLVLLSTLAVSQNFSGTEMIISVGKLGFFLVLWFLGGIFLIPTFLKKAKSVMNEETLLIVSLALCLLMVMLASAVGFSPALGAFIMGSILAETAHAEKIEHLVKSVKDLFGAIFFVSVGMLIEPGILLDYAGPVILITCITIFGKLISTSIGALLSGQPLKHSIQSGMSLAQIGEFSFIIATLGLTLKVTSDFLYPIAVAVSSITTFTTPYMIRYSESLYNLIGRGLPKKWIASLNRYSSTTQVISTTSDWKIVLHSYLYNSIIHSVIIISIIIISLTYLFPFFEKQFPNSNHALITGSISILLMAPFIWALSVRRIQQTAYSNLWETQKFSRGILVAIEVFRIALGVFYISFLISQFFSSSIPIIVALIVIGLMIYNSSKLIQVLYDWAEVRFITNLNERENIEQQRTRPKLVPWDAHLVEMVVDPESSFIGQTLSQVAIREKFGVNIALIERGRLTIATPGKDEYIYPGDKLLVIGTDEELELLKPLIEVVPTEAQFDIFDKESLSLQSIYVDAKSKLTSVSIRSSGIREKAKGLVVGVERDGERILNPDSTIIFKSGDIVWIVGNPKQIHDFLK